MTATPTIAPRVADPPMAHTSEPEAAAAPQAAAAADGIRRPRLRDEIADNPLLTLFGGITAALLAIFGTIIVAVLVFALGTMNDRFDDVHARIDDTNASISSGLDDVHARIDDTNASISAGFDRLDASINARIDRLDARISARIDRLETKVDGLDDKVDNIDLKLTALIAALKMTGEVESAFAGKIAAAEVPEPV